MLELLEEKVKKMIPSAVIEQFSSGRELLKSNTKADIFQEMRKESEQQKAMEIARNFYNLGVDVEKISQGVGYAAETVKEWLGLSDDAR